MYTSCLPRASSRYKLKRKTWRHSNRINTRHNRRKEVWERQGRKLPKIGLWKSEKGGLTFVKKNIVSAKGQKKHGLCMAHWRATIIQCFRTTRIIKFESNIITWRCIIKLLDFISPYPQNRPKQNPNSHFFTIVKIP
jgi:hypothetical protein